MKISIKEFEKIQKVIEKIQSGKFDELDIENLLIKLRAYAKMDSVFKEVSHFVAHSDARDQGIAKSTINSFYLALKFFEDYTSSNKNLDITKEFPKYVYEFFLSQASLCDEEYLKSQFKLSKKSLISKIKECFTTCHDKDFRIANHKKLKKDFVAALSYAIQRVYVRPAFHIDTFHEELLDLITEQKFHVNIEKFTKQKDRISLAIYCLISNTPFKLSNNEIANCEISTENHFRIISGSRLLPTGSISTEPSSFGNLTILAKVGKFCFTLIESNLSPHDHCDEKLFHRDYINDDTYRASSIEIINLSPNMKLSSDFKLIRID